MTTKDKYAARRESKALSANEETEAGGHSFLRASDYARDKHSRFNDKRFKHVDIDDVDTLVSCGLKQ
jgi:hypothetical protein